LSGYFGDGVWRTVSLGCAVTVILLISASHLSRIIIIGSHLHQQGKINGKKRWRKGDIAGVKREREWGELGLKKED
jgi:hypothetical protein